MSGFVGKVWVNGECGVSREKKFELHRVVQRTSPEDIAWNSAMLRVHGLEECLRYQALKLGEIPGESVLFDTNSPGISPKGSDSTLGLSQVSNSHKVVRGQKGITRYGAKLTRNAAFLVERSAEMGCLSFLTLTLPNVSQEDAASCSENWSEVVRVFLQWLRRVLRKRKLPGEIVGCSEVQEKRAALTGIFGLHLHLVFVGRKRKQSWVISSGEIRTAWQRALKPFLSGQQGDYDWRACERLESVRKSAQGYLGKYMSKGLKSCQKLRAMFPDIVFPSCWYVCTSDLRKRVMKGMIRVSGELGRVLVDILESAEPDYVCYCSAIKLDTPHGELSLGYVGRLTQMGVSQFAAFIQASRGYENQSSVLIGQFL